MRKTDGVRRTTRLGRGVAETMEEAMPVVSGFLRQMAKVDEFLGEPEPSMAGPVVSGVVARAPRTNVVALPLGSGSPYYGQYVRSGEYGICCYCGTTVRSDRLRPASAAATAGGRLLYGEVAGACADEAWCLERRRERNLDQATLDAYWGASGTTWESVLDDRPSASCVPDSAPFRREGKSAEVVCDFSAAVARVAP